MNIKFTEWYLADERNETEVDDVFRRAEADCIARTRDTLMPDRDNNWDTGESRLSVKPKEGSESAIAGYAPPPPSLI